MTGFATAATGIGGATLNLELRTVNSRFLDLHFRLPDELRAIEPVLREQITAALGRGKVDCRASLQASGDAGRELAINAGLLARLAALDAGVRAALPQAAPLSVAEVLRWPGMLGDDAIASEALVEAAGRLVRQVLAELTASRAREGGRLAAMLMERVVRMRELVAQVTPRVPEVVRDYQARLVQKLQEAIGSADDERIRTEVGLFAVRIDVAEELNRLSAHLDEVERILGKGGTAGKRLDFLMQELNREANTLASKSVAQDVGAVAMELKILIEQMREQVQNIE
ncbi:YicC/YloC family endoribonuclease [Methyloversatilis thermotolerans]|uniref:YicC/YloC family endoribonuclease n=1 Tax=Methyloversatilis thermotolerans TaxID=1346290 RepID=UPI0004774957|nr:YicC/YloC family endoribonuclease [Methyloversatilis thermotolerans]